jgi:hypothetical protein
MKHCLIIPVVCIGCLWPVRFHCNVLSLYIPRHVQVEEKLEAGQGKSTFRRVFSRFCTPIFLEVYVPSYHLDYGVSQKDIFTEIRFEMD